MIIVVSSWILADLQFGGYFRVNYDTENWNLSAEQLMVNYTDIPAVTTCYG